MFRTSRFTFVEMAPETPKKTKQL